MYCYIFNCKIFKYPAKKIEVKYQKQVKYSITLLIILLLSPSAYFAWSLYEQQKFTQSVNTFIEKEFTDKGETLIYKKTNYQNNPKTIELAFLVKHFDKDEVKKTGFTIEFLWHPKNKTYY